MLTALLVPLSAGERSLQPRLPRLPTQYETVVKCNIVNKNYTVNVHEIYDKPNERAMLSRFHPSDGPGAGDETGYSTTLYLYNYNEFIHTNSSGCFGGPVSEMGRRQPIAANGLLAPTREYFNFAQDDQNEVYMGVANINGEPCDHWQSVAVSNGPCFWCGDEDATKVVTYSNMTFDYYFSTVDWDVPASNWSQVLKLFRRL